MGIREALVDMCAAFNAHDLDAIMEMFDDDCVLDMPRGPDPRGSHYEGRAAVRAALAGRFEGLPDVHYGHEQHFVDEEAMTGMSKWLLTGTTRDGARRMVQGCDFYTFNAGGKVTAKDSYWKIVEPH